MPSKIGKKPIYVIVYEKISSLIHSGVYKPGEKLPGEVMLSKEFNVSRASLRQALLILKENGIIYNKQGNGNFVTNRTNKYINGLERLTGIPRSLSKEPMRDDLIEIVYEHPGKYLKGKLEIESSSTIIITCHKKYFTEDDISCYSVYILPIEVLTELNVNLDIEADVSKFMETLVEHSVKSSIRIVFTEAGIFLEGVLGVPLNSKIVMIEETMYDTHGNVIASNRHSMLPRYFDYSVNRNKS